MVTKTVAVQDPEEDGLVAFIEALTEFERTLDLRQSFSFFDAVNMTGQEIRHSRFLAFLLNPTAEHGFGDLFLRAFLGAVVIDHPSQSVTRLDIAVGNLSGARVECERHHFDVVIELPQMELLVMVENKIGARESDEQLAGYREVAQKTYPDYEILGCFLTPEGYEGADEQWGVLSYRVIAEELCQLLQRAVVSVEVQIVIQHYIRLIERKIVPSTKIIEACKTIYRDHKLAFDLIVRHGQVSSLAVAFDLLKNGVYSDFEQEAVRSDTVFFVFCGWKTSFKSMPEALKGAWPSNYPVLMWFKQNGGKLWLTLEVGPYKGGLKPERTRFIADLRAQLKIPQPKPGGKGNGDTYTRVKTESAKVGEDPSVEDLVTAMQELCKRIQVSEVKTAVSEAICAGATPDSPTPVSASSANQA
jgi:hypothetical protein